MPYLKMQTNQIIEDRDLIKRLSAKAAEELGKSESYVMVALEPDSEMSFGGTKKPAAFIELKSIGLKESMTERLSKMLCDFVNEELNIPKNRVYIEFSDAPGKMWGWNGGTF
jgi:phenylpyruvate tautomerase PptA (4-oxalocrotonate tautomerase family)